MEGAKRMEAWEAAMNRSSWDSAKAKASPSATTFKTTQQRQSFQKPSQVMVKQSGEERKLNVPSAQQSSGTQLYGAKKPASTGRGTDSQKWDMSAELMLDYCLSNSEKFTGEEKHVAKTLLSELKQKYTPEFSKYKGNRDGIGAQALPKDLALLQRKLMALEKKVSFWSAAEAGLHDAVTFGFGKQAERENAEKRYAYYRSTDRQLTKEEMTDYLILKSQGGRSSFDVAKEQNSLAYGGGNLTGQAVTYALGNGAIGAASGLGAAVTKIGNAISAATKGKIGAEVAKNIVSGRMTDVPADLIRAAQTTDNPIDFWKQFGTDQATGLLIDGGLEGITYAWKRLRNVVIPEKKGALNLPNKPVDDKLNAKEGKSQRNTFEKSPSLKNASPKLRVAYETPPGASRPIRIYTDGYARVNVGKIETYIRGKVQVDIESTSRRIEELKKIEKNSKETFSPKLKAELKMHNDNLHRFERSQEMNVTLNYAGIPDTPEENLRIAENIIGASRKVSPGNTIVSSTFDGAKGKIIIETWWKISGDGTVYLATIVLKPIK